MNLFAALTPSESKRLIGKAVAEMPMVKECMKKGKIVISVGSTAGFVAEELLQSKLELERFPCGAITMGRPCRTPDDRIGTIFIEKGKRVDRSGVEDEAQDAVQYMNTLGTGDLYIKGANALDKEGNVGFLIANATGGNVLAFASRYATKRIPFIVPIGLEKLVPSVQEASRAIKGQDNYEYSFGRACGFYAVADAIVVTEIEAIDILCGAKAVHVSSGGIGGSEGSVVLSVSGTEEQIKLLFDLLKGIKGEKPIENWKMDCKDCSSLCNYPGR